MKHLFIIAFMFTSFFVSAQGLNIRAVKAEQNKETKKTEKKQKKSKKVKTDKEEKNPAVRFEDLY
ncbi:hypothetical protein MY04_4643 [Flammeovirga sp. MY04]|uniref:hypothetical protein n=1 Tax=Flammeovirga sp. MY04 TaxID=1191459 RepID=UPI0008060984|nr:hypothetical protein [Flammeovirga sp. MY04]ANQ51978.1 hypothetical protein MY04_4643 [Flammeovirga sp. MY04]